MLEHYIILHFGFHIGHQTDKGMTDKNFYVDFFDFFDFERVDLELIILTRVLFIWSINMFWSNKNISLVYASNFLPLRAKTLSF